MDRFAELQRVAPQDDHIVVNIPPASSTDDAMSSYFAGVVDVQEGVRQLKDLTEEIKAKQAESLIATDADASRALSEELEDLIQTVKTKSETTKASLKGLDEALKTAEEGGDEAVKHRSAEVRIQRNQISNLSHQFLAAMQDYNETSQGYSRELKKQVVRRIRTTDEGAKLNEEEAAALAQQLLDEGKEDAMFEQAQGTLAQIRENHMDIKRIERSMRELHGLFTELQSMVEEQGELLDDIQENVNTSVAYVAMGRANMRDAARIANKTRKRMCCVVCVILVLILALIAGYAIFGNLF